MNWGFYFWGLYIRDPIILVPYLVTPMSESKVEVVAMLVRNSAGQKGGSSTAEWAKTPAIPSTRA